MIKYITRVLMLFMILIFITVCMSWSEELQNDEYILTHYFLNGDEIFIKKNKKEVIKVVFDWKSRRTSQGIEYFYIKIYYKNKFKKIIKSIDRFDFGISLVRLESTELFCKKKYIVITLRNYSQALIGQTNNYYSEIFVDMNGEKGEFSYLQYDENKKEGPFSMEFIKRNYNYSCTNYGVFFR